MKKKHPHGYDHADGPLADDGHPHGPFWLHAHKNRTFQVVVVAMLLAIFVYVVTNDLAWVPRITLWHRN